MSFAVLASHLKLAFMAWDLSEFAEEKNVRNVSAMELPV
jgi:hypothetical protein